MNKKMTPMPAPDPVKDAVLLAEAIKVIKYYSHAGQTRKVKGRIIEVDPDAGPLYEYIEVPMADSGEKAREFLNFLEKNKA